MKSVVMSVLLKTLKLKGKYRFCGTSCYFVYILQKTLLKQKLHIFKTSITVQSFKITH